MTTHKIEFPEEADYFDFDGGVYPVDDGSGNYVEITRKPDYMCGNPWEEYDCYGVVSGWTDETPENGDKRLFSNRGGSLIYRYDESYKKAVAEGWAEDENGKATEESIKKALDNDFDRLRNFCEGNWHYEQIIVTLRDKDGNEIERTGMGGIESDTDAESKALFTRDVTEDLMCGYDEIKKEYESRDQSPGM